MLLLTLILACGDKSEEDTATEETAVIEDTAEAQ